MSNYRCAAKFVFLFQAEGWIEDKLKVARQENFKNVKDMQEKMKSLKKHQAFESEIMANSDRIKAIKAVAIIIIFVGVYNSFLPSIRIIVRRY